MLLLYLYLFKYNIYLNINYPTNCVCVRHRYWYLFYMDFYKYISIQRENKSANMEQNWGPCPRIDIQNLQLATKVTKMLLGQYGGGSEGQKMLWSSVWD